MNTNHIMKGFLNRFHDNIVTVLILSLLSYYVFQGFFITIGLSFLQYVLVALFIGAIIINKKKKRQIRSCTIFIVFGSLCMFLSFAIIPNNSFIVAPLGFFVTYFYFSIWCLFFKYSEIETIERTLTIFHKTIFAFAVVTALLGVYQIFFDTSIGGFVVNELYGDVDKMASGVYQSRTTGLFGSAQNYGCFMGLAFCLGIFHRPKNKLVWLSCMIIILAGVIVSNSRSASSCVIIGITLGVFFYNKSKSRSIWHLIPFFALLLLFIIVAAQFIFDYDLDKYSRLLQFDNKPARDIYAETYKSTDISEYIVGHGFGYRNYTACQILGEEFYYESFGEDYESCESLFMTLWTQGGLLLLIPFLFLIAKIIRNSLKDFSFPIILCIVINMLFTPSITGLALSFICWPILLNELIKSNSKRRTVVYE